MSTLEPIILNFNGGELSPLLDGRVDTAIRAAGCRTLLNFIPLPQGPATRRPGTRFVAQAKTTGDGVWLVEFVFDRLQAYVLEIGPGYIRWFTQGGVLEDGMGAPLELAHGWDSVDDFTDEAGRCRLDIVPRGDRLWLVNGRRLPLVLSRNGAIDWSIEAFDPSDGPFLPENAGPITLKGSAVSGTVTLTASADLFTADHVGALFRLTSPNFAAVQPWRSSESVTSGDRRRQDGRVYEAQDTATTSTIPPTHDAGDVSDGTVTWRHLHNLLGIVRVTAVGSGTSATATVLERLPEEVVGSNVTGRWNLGAWSAAAAAWPVAVTFFRERLTFGRGRFIWQSVSRDYAAFRDRTTAIEQLADDGIAVELVADFPVEIQFLAPMRNQLLVGCTQGELVLRKQTETEPYGPLNITQDPVTDYGAAKLRPLRAADQRILMLQAAGRSVVELAYRLEADAIGGRELSDFADHLLEAGITDWAWQQRPDGILWCRTADDGLVAMTYGPQQGIVAWHRHRLGGDARVKRLRVIPRPTHDELWLIVERGSGATLSRSILRLERRWRQGQAVEAYFGVDAGLSLESETPVTSITGLDHLEGEAVIGLTDGAEHPPVTVEDGAIALAWSARTAHFGLALESDLEPMPIEAPTQRGSLQGRKARVQALVLRLLDALSCRVGPGPARLQNVALRSPAIPLGSPQPPLRGDYVVDAFPGDWHRQPALFLRMDGAGPGTVVALMPQLETSR